MGKYSQFTYDNAMLLRAATQITSTETGSTILNLGSGLVDGSLVLDISTLDTTTGDEAYSFMLEGSPDATFGTAGNIVVLAELRVGGATFTTPNGAADTTGRFVIPFRNERNGTTYPYVRLYVLIAGTTPILNFVGWIARDING